MPKPPRRPRTTFASGLLALLIAGGALFVGASPAIASGDELPVRGEVSRLLRQAYEYDYGNSNGNVFRGSRHFHPTRNVFRSSRYYRNRLAASGAGYPIRTIVRHEHSGGGVGHDRRDGRRGRVHERQYVHHRATALGSDVRGFVSLGAPESAYQDTPASAYAPSAPVRERVLPRTADEIPMEVIRIEPARPATERPVMRRERLPDGRVRTIIESTPIQDND